MAGGQAYSEAEVELLGRLFARPLSHQEVFDTYREAGYKRGFDAICKAKLVHEDVRAAIARHRAELVTPQHVERALSGEYVPGVTIGTITEPVKPPLLDPAQVWERRKLETRAAVEWQTARHQASISFDEDKPIGLSFVSDQHISESGAVMLDQMEADARLIAETDGLYAVLGGDGVDNAIKHRAAVVNSASKPSTEWRMYDHYLGFFGDSLAAMISGNHDDWTQDFVGVDMVSQIAKRRGLFFAPDYILLTVNVGGQDYRVLVRHQYRFNSSYNTTHSAKQLLRMGDHDADVVTLCHKHEAAMEPWSHQGVIRWAFRPGSYQVVTGFSRRLGFNHGVPTCPTVILWPGTRRMLGFYNVADAAFHLTCLRG